MLKSSKSFKLKTREKDQSQRQFKVSQAIHSALIGCFRKNAKLDYRLDGCPLSITKVNISSDLKLANCFFLPFNTTLTGEEIIEALEASRFVIRDYVTRQINLKYSPEVKFYYDSTFDAISLIEELIKK